MNRGDNRWLRLRLSAAPEPDLETAGRYRIVFGIALGSRILRLFTVESAAVKNVLSSDGYLEDAILWQPKRLGRHCWLTTLLRAKLDLNTLPNFKPKEC